MKSMAVSAGLLAVVLVSWFMFMGYAEDIIDKHIDTLEGEVLVSIESEEWLEARQTLEHTEQQWDDAKGIFRYFLNTNAVNNIDMCFSRAFRYIAAEEKGSAASEITDLINQMHFLYQNERLSLANLL